MSKWILDYENDTLVNLDAFDRIEFGVVPGEEVSRLTGASTYIQLCRSDEEGYTLLYSSLKDMQNDFRAIKEFLEPIHMNTCVNDSD